jgi:D-sedoheptulose 7-phosphate isomerase
VLTSASSEAHVAAAFARRVGPLQALAEQAPGLARAARELAERFRRGGRLLVFGSGTSAADAQHVSVEFVHPVVVGKRALPALALAGSGAGFAHQVAVLGRPDDIALGLSADGSCADVLAGLQAAGEGGLLTIALLGGDGGAVLARGTPAHAVVVPSTDALVVREGHVTAYHLLWELTHVFLDVVEGGAGGAPRGGVEQLYPFLYGGEQDDALAAATGTAHHKLEEVVGLRRAAGEEWASALAACADDLAAAFAAGGTLLAFGNGGSSTDAQAVVHAFVDPPDPATALPALCLTSDAAVLTALANDIGVDAVFARQIAALARPGDIALGLSTSGGSANVLNGLAEAEKQGLLTVGLAGHGGGPMAELPGLRHLLAVPSASVHRIQEVQTTLYHVLWEATTRALAAAPPPPLPGRG